MSRFYHYCQQTRRRTEVEKQKTKHSLILQFQNILDTGKTFDDETAGKTVDIETANNYLDIMLSNKDIIKPSKEWNKFINISKSKCQDFIYDAEFIIFNILGKRPYFEDQPADLKNFQRTREYYLDLEDYKGSIELVKKCSDWLKHIN